MTLFSRFFRTKPQEEDSLPPLIPSASGTLTPTTVDTPTKLILLNVEEDLLGESEDEKDLPVYRGFESLCNRYEQQLLDLQSLRSAHQEALSTIEDLRSQLARTVEGNRQAIEAQKSNLAALSAQLRDATAQIKQLRSQKDEKNVNLRNEIRQQQKNFAKKENDHRDREKKLKDEHLVTSKALALANQALEEQRILCEEIAGQAGEASRLPKGILRSTFAAPFVQPFVVLLVDGDAYKFPRELSKDSLHGGARAAHRIKTEVLNYMASHDGIPLHSKIVVRVFFNASSRQGKLGMDGIRSTAASHTFMIQFSETHPLFDFLDCGSGKERADTKIRQNFELFIDNPYCRAMFLAVCYDGGFVRMLEPYQHSEDALAKIILIKAGQVAPGFLAVPKFQFTEFKSVFRELYSLKIGPIENRLYGADGTKPVEVQTQGVLSSNNETEPEDLPIGSVPYAPWIHPKSYVRTTTTLVGLAYKATLLGMMSRRAIPTPELIALRISSFQRSSRNDSTKAGSQQKTRSK